MARLDSNELFHIVNVNIQNVLENGLLEIKKLSKNTKSTQTIPFLRQITFLIDHVISRIRVLPEIEENEHAHYRELLRETNSAREHISALSKTLEHQRLKHRRIEDHINSQYDTNMKLVEEIINKCTNDTELTLKYERMQIDEYKHSESRQVDLKQIYTITNNKMHSSKSLNERLENELRSKRFKVLSQYKSLIDRYDNEIGSRKKQIVDLQVEFNALQKEYHELQLEIQQQSAVFDSCMFAIHEEKIRDFMNRLAELRKLRAAKIIQRWWRILMRKRKESTKKRKKKRKKKKKRRKVSP